MHLITVDTSAVTIQSHAKINIGLKIVRKRDDGYHDIETIFKIVGLHDIVSIRANHSNVIKIFCSDARVPADASNIAVKAVKLLQEKTGRGFAVDIDISKNIPIGAGLGGGSSNGASVLAGLNELFHLGLSADELLKCGARLGSDVPFFVGFLLGMGNTAVGSGRGEILDFFTWDLTEKVVLVNPNIEISTAWAYQNFAAYVPPESLRNASLNLTNTSKSVKFSALLEKPVFFDNYFEPLVFATHPKIRGLREMLEKEKAVFSRLSGSGSTVFGLFEKQRNLENLKNHFSGCTVIICDFV
jgi:4-diphosphocytidyl-2-C-methyl-D-erythritol kinase